MMDCLCKSTILHKRSLVVLIVVIITSLLLFALSLVITERNYCGTEACIAAARDISSIIDVYQNPCYNLHKIACDEKTRNESNLDQLKAILSELSQTNDTNSLTLQKTFYRSCTNVTAIDNDNDTTFLNLITQIGGWPVVEGNNWNETAFDLVELIVNLREVGLPFSWLFDVSRYPKSKNMFVLEINIPGHSEIDDSSIEYFSLMKNAAVGLGAHETVAEIEMRDVAFFANKLTNLIEESDSANKNRYPNRSIPLITISQVQERWQKINWLEFLNKISNRKLGEHQQVAFFVDDYLPKLQELLEKTRKRTQANYIVWKIVEAYSLFLTSKVRSLFSNSVYASRWYNNRELYCLQQSQLIFPHSLEAEYLRRYVPTTIYKKIEEVIEQIMLLLEEYIKDASWVNNEARTVTISKLQNLSYIIGGPEEMYYAKQFDDYVRDKKIILDSSDIISISTEIYRKTLDTLFRPNMKSNNYLKNTFYELVPSFNVLFYREYNLLWIPAGAIQKFVSEQSLGYIIYGTLGTVIGQELASNFIDLRSLTNNVTDTCFSNCRSIYRSQQDYCIHNTIKDMIYKAGVHVSYKAYAQWLKNHSSERNLPAINLNNQQMFWMAHISMMCHLSPIKLNYSTEDDLKPWGRAISLLSSSEHFINDFKCSWTTKSQGRCQIL